MAVPLIAANRGMKSAGAGWSGSAARYAACASSEATPRRDYYCQSRRGNRLFDLDLGEVALAFCATSAKADQGAINDLLDRHGPAGFAAAWLSHRNLGWAADLVRTPSSASHPEQIP